MKILKIIIFVVSVKKNINSNTVRDGCDLTGKRREIIGYDNILDIVNEIEALISKEKYNGESIEDLKRIFQMKLKK